MRNYENVLSDSLEIYFFILRPTHIHCTVEFELVFYAEDYRTFCA